MNCADVRARLAALLYGDLPDGEAAELRAHLARCASCREEHAALVGVRRLLDAAPVPEVAVDLSRLYREAAERQTRRLRRWRRAAVAGLAAAAAVVLGVFLSRLEIRVEAQQVVVRWGNVPPPPAPQPPEPPVPKPVPPEEGRAEAVASSSPEVEQQLRLLSELVQALSGDADQRDERRRGEISELRAQLQTLRKQMTQLRLTTEQDVSTLYNAQFPEKEKGTQP